MRLFFTFLFLLFSLIVSNAQQSILGKWKTIDDNTHEEKSVVEIFEKDGKVYGKIVKLFRKQGEIPDPVCDECDSDDPRYKKKVVGMEILKDMVKAGDEYSQGNVLDPSTGRIYSCKIWIEGEQLKLRGYWGPFYRTQTWLRIP